MDGGMVLVWYGLVRYRMAWYGLVWYAHAITTSCTVRHGVIGGFVIYRYRTLSYLRGVYICAVWCVYLGLRAPRGGRAVWSWGCGAEAVGGVRTCRRRVCGCREDRRVVRGGCCVGGLCGFWIGCR